MINYIALAVKSSTPKNPDTPVKGIIQTRHLHFANG